jgi:galactose-1-phosphate uridylyltransferase
MIEKIEKKIEEYIDSILAKDEIDQKDYQVLSNEYARLLLIQEKEDTNKRCQESAERMQKIAEMMANGGPYMPV